MSTDRYELIDFGEGRKLESVAGLVVDRPCPAAIDHRRHDQRLWTQTDSRYDTETSRWSHREPWPSRLSIDCGSFRMPVRPTPYGHIGVFPEQQDNWRWLSRGPEPKPSTPPQALNLFGYTGASTMALVSAGYCVAHVDASKPSVQMLREVAELNGQTDAPIRYLVDDAAKFAAREVRRGRKYDTIVLDPPAYGHSPQGKAWRLQRDLWPLLENCLRLVDPNGFRLLITGHSPEVNQDDVSDYLHQSRNLHPPLVSSALLIDSGRSQLKDSVGRSLDAGFYVRVTNR